MLGALAPGVMQMSHFVIFCVDRVHFTLKFQKMARFVHFHQELSNVHGHSRQGGQESYILSLTESKFFTEGLTMLFAFLKFYNKNLSNPTY